ncbi:SH2 domain-containing protein [Dictyostelium purpureum]|uniref:SH2 domain-containing protein n=1 Tax=Dictyostelium purpureum TaxID=5786 RepID=F1A1N7_DICPU|nr:SH2 domain-containing protein [Dictyostelium purpureum]EGC29890.1 SH2 domain-containing protein [Dictyostelium purpureum]|eukprot:XP_003293584.1 SH2 domain-containing protein [Dictyostelium purpureum]
MDKISQYESLIAQLEKEVKEIEARQLLKENEIRSLVDLAISSKSPNAQINRDQIDKLFRESISDLKLKAEKIQKLEEYKQEIITSLLVEPKSPNDVSIISVWEQLKVSSFRKVDNTNTDSNYTYSSVILNESENENSSPVQTKANNEEEEIIRWEIDRNEISYNREAKLGSGAFGSVYKGIVRGKEVAIKKLTQTVFEENTMNEFRKEVSLMAKLRNPHLLLFMGACTTPDDLSIVTELMPKGSVHSLLRAKEDSPDFITFKRAILIARDTALGMTWLHASNILHLDLKPANLLVDQNWVVKVADFGLSKYMKKGATQSGQAGSPLYMAPEMLLNQPYDEKVDVFSFVILLWELLTKQEPYNKLYSSYPQLVEGVVNKKNRPIIPDYFPSRLKDLLNRCWDHHPARRPSFAEITKSKFLESILIDGLILDPSGRQFWAQYYLGKEEASWNSFIINFSLFCGYESHLHSDDIKLKFLKLLLVPSDSDVVTIDMFGKILTWCGPLTNGKDFFEKVYSICSIKGFLGQTSSKNANTYLAGKKPGTYILRFSSDPGSYAISYLNKNKEIVHARVIYKPGSGYIHHGGQTHYSTLDDLIKNTFKSLGIKEPFEGGPFHALSVAASKGPNFNVVGSYIAVSNGKKI